MRRRIGRARTGLDRRGEAAGDYVGFINRGIPAGGIFAGAEVPKTQEQVALFGGVAGKQYDPCYHERATTSTRSPASRRRRR